MTTQSDFDMRQGPTPGRKYFTVAEANQALPYVSRVVEDIRQTYKRAVELQERMERPMPGDEDGGDLQKAYEQAVEQLNRYVDELRGAGVELKDYEMGLADFPAVYEGREVYLCWKAGEERILAWHEIEGGYAGRQDISTIEESERGEVE